MLAFIDESGDSGLNIEKGASQFFVVALVVFEDHALAEKCDQRIALLKGEMGRPSNFEFHFSENSRKVRERFLEAIAPYNFFYFGFCLNKGSPNLWGPGFQCSDSLYKWTCGTIFENAKPYLRNTIVVIDKSGSATFRSQLAKYLIQQRNEAIEGTPLIKKVKLQPSHANNLLQLADYVAAILNRKVQGKRDWEKYYRFIAVKEVDCRIWPR